MIFNPENRTKQSQQVIFAEELRSYSFWLSNIPSTNFMFQKHRSLTLNMNFLKHIKVIMDLLHPLPLLYIVSESDYNDIMRYQAYSSSPSFYEKLEFIQYNACLAIKGVIGCTSSKHYSKSWALNIFNRDVGLENFATLKKHPM